MGLMLLAIAVNTPVTLLEDHERPWNVEMNQLVREEMKVDTFARNVRRNEQPGWRVFAAELLRHYIAISRRRYPGRKGWQSGSVLALDPSLNGLSGTSTFPRAR